MKTCRACGQQIPEPVGRCPHCGAVLIEETIVCPTCGQENALANLHCVYCGHHFFGAGSSEAPPPTDDLFDTSHMDRLHREVASRFEKHFEQRLAEEHHPERHEAYRQRLLRSPFRQTLDLRLQQLAEEIADIGPDFRNRQVKRTLENTFEELLDLFIIRHCSDLNEVHYPEAILRYHGRTLAEIDLKNMVLDFLDLDSADLSWFADFVTMPSHKLKNAADHFLFPRRDESLLIIVDTSITSSCKSGFALTSRCIYWRTELEPPQRVYYHKLESAYREEDWMKINDIFFHASLPVNLKLIRLLKKLRALFRLEG